MTRPRIAVLGPSLPLSEELAARWKALAPVEFVPFESTDELLHDLGRERYDGVIVHRDAPANDGVPAWRVVAYNTPALPVVRWGDQDRLSIADTRAAPLVAMGTQEALAAFIMNEIVSVARGRLSGVSLPSVLQVLQMEQRTCRLRVRTGHSMGELFVRSGALIHASFKKREPNDAALEMLAWSDADVVFDRLPMNTEPTIDSPLDFMLMESARLKDERSLSASIPPLDHAPSSASTSSWLVPAVLRGDADALATQIIALPGAAICAIIDHENRVLVAARTSGEAIPRLHGAVSDLMSSLRVLIDDLRLAPNTDDILVTLASAYVILRPLRSMPNFVAVASFQKETATLGLLRSQLARLCNDFAVAPIGD
ncbi:MAG: DUF4388 domain-containing protein [Myxococcales bacterium]|nr:DUF4388 domain-containing protein [Myxococcales bacterium]